MTADGDRPPLKEVLLQYLEDGESLHASRDGDDIEIERNAKKEDSPLKKSHPELHALLLDVEKEIDDASGCILAFIFIGAAVAFYWLAKSDVIPGIPVGTVDGFGDFIILVLMALALWGVVVNLQERSAYRNRRHELIEAVHAAGLDRRTLLAALKEDDDFNDLPKRLRKERDLSWEE